MDIDGLVQGSSNSISDTQESLQPCPKPPIYEINFYASIWHLPIIRIIELHKWNYVAP